MALAVLLLGSIQVRGQLPVLKTLRHFSAPEGTYPNGGLVGIGTTLYGTTQKGGSAGHGTIFRINIDGTGFTILKSFQGTDGSNPYASLVLSGNVLYGTTFQGGPAGVGNIFRINTDGTGFAVLRSFGGPDGANPYASISLSGSTLYGTTVAGGTSGTGVLFRVQTNGSGFAVLRSFAGTDGIRPYGGVTLAGNLLYGTTFLGGQFSGGTVYRINADGTGFTVLKHCTSSEGLNPYSSVIVVGTELYGVASAGGSDSHGSIFAVGVDGASFRPLHHFSGLDGASPWAQLISFDGAIYGSTSAGGTEDVGTLFRINPDGSGFSTLKEFVSSEGARPYSGLTLLNGTLYGSAYQGGATGNGSLFRINLDGSGFGIVNHFSVAEGLSPYAGVVVFENRVYGTTSSGGTGGGGTVFRVNLNGTGFTVLKSFSGTDGSFPWSTLVLSGNTLYGTTVSGGSAGKGTIFKINTDGSGFQVLKHLLGSDGAYPYESLVLTGDRLFGTAYSGGSVDAGTVFRVNTDGTGFAVLKDFQISDGQVPYSSVVVSGDYVFGATYSGGTSGKGVVYRVNTDGTGFQILRDFTGTDGANPYAQLVLANGALYGTTVSGGNGHGTVFRVGVNGTDFSILRNFSGNDGRNPQASLTLSGSMLYGTTVSGGASGNGTVFRVGTDGTGFTVLKTFASSEGSKIYSGVVVSGSQLWGTTMQGGSSGGGTIYRMNTSGSGFTVLKSFKVTDGANPYPTLLLSGTTLFGTTAAGGSGGYGTVFSIPIRASQTITFPALSDRGYGSPSFNLGATASSGLPVTYTSLTPSVASVSGNSVTILAAGVATIRASQGGNGTYLPATSVNRTFDVTPAALLVSADSFVRAYGEPNPSFTGSLSGVVAGDAITVTFSTEATAVSSPGLFPITPNLVDPDGRLVNYAIDLTPGVLQVTQASQNISFGPLAPRTYGTAPFGISATANSGLLVTLESSDPLVATVNGAVVTVVGAGTTTITASQAGDINYLAATPVSQMLTVSRATPVITWANPAAITYGTPLSATQLNAAADVPGTFRYTPASGTILGAGSGQNLSATFAPQDSANYRSASASVLINVNRATPVITWADPAAITYGTPLSATQLNATADVPGIFSYTPATGTILGAGSGQNLSVTFAPQDSANYRSASASVLISVNRARPVITWANPAAITYGTPLSATQLNATAGVPGTFSYTPASGTILGAGSGQNLSVTFAPQDSANYRNASESVLINVNRARPVITWADPAAVTYGTPLSATQLNATANVPGTFSYTPNAGTILNVGTAQQLSVSFAPTDSINYRTNAAVALIDVLQITPTITWPAPKPIAVGTALSRLQLNASANSPGTLTYDPPARTVLGVGNGRRLTVTFDPADPTTVNSVVAEVPINVFLPLPNNSRYERIFSFDEPANSGSLPLASLVQGQDQSLYGTTSTGGAAGQGCIFKLRPDGTGFTLLHSFGITSQDGRQPRADLIQGSDGLLYGTTYLGGPRDGGTLFRIARNGSNYRVLRAFDPTRLEGHWPQSGLLEGNDGRLYGSTFAGGASGGGTIFRANLDGSDFTILRSLNEAVGDGIQPLARMIWGSDGKLYGTTQRGGSGGWGTVFKMNASGSGFDVLHDFSEGDDQGSNIRSSVVEGLDGSLYGTSADGGAGGNGVIFKLGRNGSGFMVLHTFTDSEANRGLIVSSDGYLYGTSPQAGNPGQGTLFRITGNGTGYSVFHDFGRVPKDGKNPYAALIEGTDGSFYGVTAGGGDQNFGSLFRIKIATGALSASDDAYAASTGLVLEVAWPGILGNDLYFQRGGPRVFRFSGHTLSTESDWPVGESFFGYFSFDPAAIGVPAADPTLVWQYGSPTGKWALEFPERGYRFSGVDTDVGVGDNTVSGDRYLLTGLSAQTKAGLLPSGRVPDFVQFDLFDSASQGADMLSDSSLPVIPVNLSLASGRGGRLAFVDGSEAGLVWEHLSLDLSVRKVNGVEDMWGEASFCLPEQS